METRGTSRRQHGSAGWSGRPGWARALRVLLALGPTLVALAFGVVVRRVAPPERLGVDVWLWLVGLLAASVLVAAVADHAARRFTPLVVLLRMSLVFPDRAPSRFRTAMRNGTTRSLQRRIIEIRASGVALDDESRHAEQMLELVAALSHHDRLTRGHCERVRAYTDLLIEEMGIEEADAARLRWAALLHDVGKIMVSADILNKPGRPTDEEWEELRSHTWQGQRMVKPLREWLGPWALAVGQHHERWDGGGYPLGLSGEQIHLGGRIVAVADAYDVMTSTRSYKVPMPAHEARAEIARCSGSQFDPVVARAFLRIGARRARWATGVFAWLNSLPMLQSGSAASVVSAVSSSAGSVVSAGVVAGALAVGPIVPSIGLPTIGADGDPTDVVAVEAVPAATTTTPIGAAHVDIAPTLPAVVAATPDVRTTTTVASTTTPAPTTTVASMTTLAPITVATTTEPPPEPVRVVVAPVITDEDVTATVQLRASGPARMTVTAVPALGAATLTPAVPADPDAETAWVWDLRYVPDSQVHGSDAVPVEICGPLQCETAVVDVTVRSQPDPPEPAPDEATVPWDGVAVIDVAANDADPDGHVTASTVTLPSPAIGWSVAATTVSYEASAGGSGRHTTPYEICDPDGLCARGEVTVIVDDRPNRAPIIEPLATIHTAVGADADASVSATDPDGDPITYDAVGLPDGLTLTTEGRLLGSPDAALVGTRHRVTVIATDGDVQATAGVDVVVARHVASALRGRLHISEVRYAVSGPRHTRQTHGEFVEIVNGGPDHVDVTGLVLRDGLGPAFGALVRVLDDEDTRGRRSVLAPGERAVVVIGDHQAAGPEALHYVVPFAPGGLLADGGDDLWLFDGDGDLVDYVAWGSGAQILADPPGPVFFDPSGQTDLVGAAGGQSISLATPTFAPSARCWELTTSATATAGGGCPGAGATVAVIGDSLSSRGSANLVQ